MMTRILALLLLVVMMGCALLSWTLFTRWGLLASYVGSHKGGMALRSELDAAEAEALRTLSYVIALQVILFASSGFFVHSFTQERRSRFWPSLKSWMIAFLLSTGLDGLVIAAMFYRQTQG